MLGLSSAYHQRMIEARKPKVDPPKCPRCGKKLAKNAKPGR